MTEIWLVRHGETAWSRSGQHTSLTDLELTVEGKEAADSLAAKLAGQSFDRVLCSPLQRAQETARRAGFANPEICGELVEWHYGAGEGLTTAQIQTVIPHWRIWTHGAPAANLSELPVSGQQKPALNQGESIADVTKRLGAFVVSLRHSDAEKILCFGHGHALRAMSALWCELDVAAGAHFPLATGSLSILGWEKTTPALLRWNA
ncbi:MAG: histidine phosphatase family protein [Propionibacteriaceae bacterium]